MTSGNLRRHWCLPLAAFVIGNVHAAAALAQHGDIPPYLDNGSDPMQQAFGTAVLGFAMDRKCGFLADAVRTSYEQSLDQAKILFEQHLVAKGIVNERSSAVLYTRQLILGSIRFAATLACDAEAAVLTQRGLQTSQFFRELVKPHHQQSDGERSGNPQLATTVSSGPHPPADARQPGRMPPAG